MANPARGLPERPPRAGRSGSLSPATVAFPATCLILLWALPWPVLGSSVHGHGFWSRISRKSSN